MFLEEAREYVNKGFWIFPCHTIVDGRCSCGVVDCGDAGKHPRTARGLKDASRDLAKIEEWFGDDAPPSNIAIVTGEISGITVIDIDIGEGKEGAESWAAAIDGYGEPDTLIAETGSGGMHFVFKYSSALKTASNVLGKGVDVRNDKGYIIASPSLHRSGGTYKWLNWGVELANLPAHLSVRKETRGRPKSEGDPISRKKYTIEQVRSMLDVIPSADRDLWRNVGVILGRTYNRMDEAWSLYNDWAAKDGVKEGRGHHEIMHDCFYNQSQIESEKQLTLGTIVKLAIDNGWAPKAGEVPVEQFVFYGPGNNFIYRPNGLYWIAGAVDAAVSPINEEGKIVKASDWLKQNQLVTSLTVDPSRGDDYVKGYDCRNGEIIATVGGALYNTYRPATIELGVANDVLPFLKHVRLVFNKVGDADQFLDYMAHRVQKPWQKPRFALLIAGEQGVGKDTAVELCMPAIGGWNVSNIDPSALESGFNEYVSATLVRISEAANLQEMSKWAFNEQTKVLIAGNPDTVTVNPKYGQKYSMKMFCGVIMTTNHLSNGIFIPEGDRRYDVIDCATKKDMGLNEEELKEHFERLWEWFENDRGAENIAAYLNTRDISKFSANSGQRKTEAHKTVVAQGYSSDYWLTDIIEELGSPVALRASWIVERAVANGMKINEVRAKMAYAMERTEYSKMVNPNIVDGRWKIAGKSTIIYSKYGISIDEALKSVEKDIF
jgi:hypothetical protein